MCLNYEICLLWKFGNNAQKATPFLFWLNQLMKNILCLSFWINIIINRDYQMAVHFNCWDDVCVFC